VRRQSTLEFVELPRFQGRSPSSIDDLVPQAEHEVQLILDWRVTDGVQSCG
jgi:hypothetical protein